MNSIKQYKIVLHYLRFLFLFYFLLLSTKSFTQITNPIIPQADLVGVCPDYGSQMPKIFLCGTGASRQINTNIPDATLTWGKLNEGSCTDVINSNCPNLSPTCSWNIVGTGSNFTVTTTGQYRITVLFTDASVQYFYFNVYTNPLDIPVTKTDIVCGKPGKITVAQLTGYQYSLDGLLYQDSNIFNITTSNTYTVRVKRNGAISSDCVFTIPNVVIAQKDLSVSALPIQPKCNSDDVNTGNNYLSKAAIKLTATNANGQYYYKILQNGSVVNQFGPTPLSEYTFSGLNSGNYSWEVKTDDCSVPLMGNLTLTSPISIETNPFAKYITKAVSGSITVSPTGGTSPYTYYLGTTLMPSNLIPIAVAGYYNVNVVDSYGCSKRTSVEVKNQPEPIFTISQTNVKCYGDKGEIKFIVTNANGNTLLFSIDNGLTYSNNATFSNLAAGTYKTVVKYTFGTSVSTKSQDVIITQPGEALKATAGVSELPGCGPTPNTNYGQLQITNPQGGIAPYLYSFDNQLTWTSDNTDYKAPGTYTLYIKDANECVFAMPDVILEDTVTPTIIVNNDSFNCDGTANSSVTVTTAQAANYTYTYSLDGGTPVGTNSFNNVTSGNHIVTVYSTPKIVPSYNDLLNEDFGYGSDTALNPVPAYCFEDQLPQTICGTNAFIADGEYSVTAKVNYLFGGAWYPVADHTPATTPAKNQGRFLAVNVKAETTYPILYEKTINSIIPNEDLKIELYATNLFSSNYSAQSPNLKIALEDVSGNEISSFTTSAIAKNQSWNFFKGILKPGANTSLRFVIRSFEKSDCGNDVAIDDIKIYQFPAKLCNFSKYFNFDVPSGKAFSALITATKNVSCAGYNNGEITITATNFDTTNGYQYSVNNGTSWQNALNSSYTVTGLASGTYSVKVRYNATGACEQTLAATTLSIPEALVTLATITNPVKCNSNATIEASSTGGTAPYHFELWDQTNTSKISTAPNSGIFTNVVAGSYIIRGLDANNCASATPFAITVPAPAALTAEINTSLSDRCYDSTNQATLVVTPTSGTMPFSYSLDGANYQTVNTFTNVGPGNHSIKVTDSNNCIATINDIYIGEELKTEAVLTKTVDCTASPDAKITVSFEGGVKPLRYKIKKGSTTITTTDITIPTADTSFTYTVSEKNAGAYSFIITDAYGCSKTTNIVTVSTKVPPVISSLVQDQFILCNGAETASINVVLDPATGVAPFTYEVRNTTNLLYYGSQLSGLSPGNYTVKITDSKSCSDTKPITISEPPKLVVETDQTNITCSGSGVTTGKVIVKKVNGGVGPYNYFLKGPNGYAVSELNNNGNIPFGFAVSKFGLYEITIVDSNLCSVLVQDILIASPPDLLDIDVTSPIINCAIGGTAKIKINSTALTSSGPFQFSIYKGTAPNYPTGTWQTEDSPGSKEATFIGLLRGVKYTFVVYDQATNCYISKTATDAIPTDSKLVAGNLVAKNISCKGAGDGKVSFQLTSNYTTNTSISYQIYDAQSIETVGLPGTGTILANSNLNILDFGILPIGKYFVLIKETSGTYAGCSIATTSFNITESLTDFNVPNITPVKNANCKENGVFTIQASGGTGPYQYQISAISVSPPIGIIPPPATAIGVYSPSNSFTAAAGTYTVFVKDAYGCVKQTTHTVTKDPEPKINLSVTNVCATEGNFEIKVDLATVGITPYYLSVNGSALQTITFPYVMSFKNSGSYSILIQDKNGCTDTKTTAILKPLSLSSKVVQLPSCYINDGKFDVFATGGSGNYQFQLDGGNSTTTPSFIGLAAGDHTVKITDLNTNCNQSISVKLEAATSITNLKFTQTNVSCKGGSNGTITASIATPSVGINDNPTYKYNLNGGTPQESNVFSGLIAGDYTLKVTSARGCEASVLVTIIEPNAITVTTPVATQYNCGLTNDLNYATINMGSINGGSGNYVQYDFFRNGILVKSQSSPTFIETDFLGGNYTVNVYDNIGCVGSSSSPVTINPFISISLEKINVKVDKAIDCISGENITVSVEGKPTNPTNLEFTLLPKSGALTGTSFPVKTDGVFIGLAVGDYLISVKNLVTNCLIGEVHYVTEPNTFDIKIDSKTDVSCFGGSNGSAQLSLIDKNTPSKAGAFSYQLKDSLGSIIALPLNSSSTNSAVITGLKAGIYTITATLTISPFCSVSKNFTIAQPSQELKLNTTHSDITCVVGNNDGSISGSASGGWSAAYQYQLQLGSATPNPWVSTPDFKGLTSGNYTLKVRDFKGCEVSAPLISLTIPTTISFSASTDINMLNCNGDQSATITVINPTGGQGNNYSYVLNQISPKTATSIAQSSNQFKNLAAGIYTVTVKDAWACATTSATTIEIKEPTKVVTSLGIQTLQTCTIQTELKLQASGGNGPYTYSADGISYNGSPFVSTSIIPVGAGTFQYYVKDANNCESVISNAITIEPLLGLSLTIDPIFANVNCYGESTAAILATAKGGLGDYFYTLLNELGGTVKPAQPSGTFSGLPAGKYIVRVQSADCAAVEKPITITQPLVKLTASYSLTNPLCGGATDGSIKVVSIGGTGVIKQAISPNLNQFFESNVFDNLGAGIYDILIQDTVGCYEKTTKTIVEPLPIDVSTISSSINQELCFDNKNAAFSIDVSGGTQPYNVSLDNPTGPFTKGGATQTQFNFTGLRGGSHTVYIQDANNCTFDWIVNLDQSVNLNPIPIVSYDCISNTAANKVKVELDSSITDFSLVQFSLDGGTYQSSSEFTNLVSGNHFIRVKHSNGCIKDTPIFNILKTDPLKLRLKQGGLNEIIALATGGGGNYKFTFNGDFTDNNNSYIYYTTQNYLVTVQDINGCTVSTTQSFNYIDICVPNYFTPNGDGISDTWSPGCTINYKDLLFTVVDRYGREIQTFKFGESWDGKYRGVELPSGDYWYVLKLNNSNDNREFVGHFTLYR